MKLILKYLKKYFLVVLAIVALTFIQVQTELTLPDYMSNIVTGGIQYGGIEEDFPSFLSKEDMNTLKLFLTNDEKKIIETNYSLVNIEFEDGKKEIYSLIGDNTHNEELTKLFEKPLAYLYLCDQGNITVNEANVELIKASLNNTIDSLADSYDNVAKLSIQSIYKKAGFDVGSIQSKYIIKAGLMMLGISLIGVVAQLLSTYFSTKMAAKSAAQIRRDVFSKVQSFSSSEFSKFSTASLITRTSNDVTKVQQLIQLMTRMMLMSPMMGITAVIKVTQYPQVSWILLVAIGIILGAMILVLILAVPKFDKIQKLTDSINNVMREFLDGMLPIRAFNAQKKEEEKFDKTNKEMSRTDRFVSRIVNGMMPVMTFVMNGLTVAIIWIASKQIDINAMSVGNMLAFLQYAMHVVISFMLVSVTFFMIPRSLVSAKRINEILETEITILDKEVTQELPNENGDLVFDNVTFRYPGAEENVLENISFTASPGETVAFIGSTGSGKSTIVKLIPRLFDVSAGAIKYCGVDIRDLKQTDLRDHIGYATQKALLFTGTMESNIKFGRELNDEDVNDAIKIAQAEDIVALSELGVKQEITQGGTNVSGGQKQRISIARTLAQNKDIYIFDDTFSALDYATDKKLREELKELIDKTHATVIMVAQRISTIKNADKIIVLDKGKIVGSGKHKELLENCEIYKEIAYSQLSLEELQNA